MQFELLEDIVSFVSGDKAKGIVYILGNKKNVNEFIIAKKLNLTINQTRNILYKLADEGLVSFIRKKDSKKGGWYIYFWTLNLDKSLSKFKENLMKNLENLRNQLHIKKTAKFFFCRNCGSEYSEDSALTNGYVCPECGEVLELKDNTKEFLSIEKEIVKFEAVLRDVERELQVVHEKEGNMRARRLKAEETKKILERAKKRKDRKKEAKKLMKNQGKKMKKAKNRDMKVSRAKYKKFRKSMNKKRKR